MALAHFEIHQLERAICETVKKGFSHKLDDGDCLQVGHDVADMIIGAYRIDPHQDVEEMPLVPGTPLEAVATGQMSVAEAYDHFATRIDGLSKDLARFAGVTGSEVER